MPKLPIEFKTGVIIFEVWLLGQKRKVPIKMVFDTGASITTIPKEAAAAIGCDPIKSRKRIEMVTASGIEYVPLVIIPKIKFLGFELKNVEVACLNLPPKSLVSGLLGINVLKNFDILLAFLKKYIEITK